MMLENIKILLLALFLLIADVFGEVFMATLVPSHLVCDQLCLYSTRCGSVIWEADLRMCRLRTRNSADKTALKHQEVPAGICRRHACGEYGTCVPLEAGTAYICLQTVSFPSTVTTTTTTTTTTTPTTTITTSTTSAPTTTVNMKSIITTSTTSITTTTNTLKTTTTTTSTTPTTFTTPTTTVSYKYEGCYTDNGARLLPNAKITDAGMTIVLCMQHCQTNDFAYFGLENSNECYCGNVIKSGYQKVAEVDCSRACPGDISLKCGGVWRLSLYTINN